MPLLINALQESNYIDPTLETSVTLSKKKRFNITILKTTLKPTFKPNLVRRTSPRPFYFEYRHPTPLPFSKTYGSRSWVEKYRNEERLKNIRQIIKYLENTIHAKVGDMHARPTEKQIAFTGLYIEPMIDSKNGEIGSKSDLHSASSDNLKKFHLNHLADPLFNFKPDNPGDVNLLADDFLRFSPIPTPGLTSASNKHPMFRQIPFQNRNCLGNKCDENKKNVIKLSVSRNEIKQTESPPVSTTKSFSVMLNLYPVKAKAEEKKQESIATTTQSVEKIYLTTSRPLIQFKRKSSVRRLYSSYKRPRYLSKLINKDTNTDKTKDNNIKEATEPDTQMIVHVQVYDDNNNISNEINNTNISSFKPSIQTNPYTTKAPIEFSTSQIEDYHAGSSGYIPIASKTDESLPKVTTMIPFFDTTTEYWNSPSNAPADVVKFNVEDAKVPNQYMDLSRHTQGDGIEISRRNSGEMIEREKLIEEINANDKEISTNSRNFEKSLESKVEPSTLIIKLKNNFSKTTTTQVSEINKANNKSNEEATTTVWTYVPQINGHYRSINQNSRNVNKWLNASPENDRKKRLEMSVSGLHTYVPMYVEIKRNNSNTADNQESTETNEEIST